MAKPKDTTIGSVVQVSDLTAGVNLRPSGTTIRPNESRRLVGTRIGSVGELGVYPGWLTFTESSLGSRRAQGGKRIYLAGVSPFTLVGDNGSVYKPADDGTWGSAVATGLNSSNQIDFVFDRSIVAVLDGASVPSKSKDGTTWTQLGITKPASAPTVSAVAGGSLASGHTYSASYAYGDSTLNHYSNASAAGTATPSGSNLTLRVAVVASADTTVDKIKVFVKDDTAGETSRRWSVTVANTSANVDITANNWDGQEEEYADHDVSVAMKFGVVWKNRWWGVDATVGNRLRFSQIFDNQSWPSLFYVDIPFDRGENITALLALSDILVVFGYTKFYLIIGQTSLDFEVRPAMGTQTGAFGFRAVDLVENGIVHAGAPGVYLFNGTSDELLSYKIEPAWKSAVEVSTAAELALLPITYHKVTKELRVAVPSLYPTGDRGEWILDLGRTNAAGADGQANGPAWFATARTVGGYLQWDGQESVAGSHGRLFSWSPTTVELFEERVGTSADGDDLLMEYDGYVVPFGIVTSRVIETYLEYQTASGTVTVDLKVDGKLMGSQSFALSTTLSKYGTAKYHQDTYSGGANRMTMPITWPETAEGRSCQLLLKYQGQGDFRVFTYGHNTISEQIPRGL